MKKSITWDRDGKHYWFGSREVDARTFARGWRVRPTDFEKGECPLMRGDRHDFRAEVDRATGQHGRYYPQLARRPGDPTAVFPTRHDAIEAGKRRGFTSFETDD